MTYKSLLVLIFSVFAFSCGETTPTLLEPGDEKENVNQGEILEMPEGVHWREEIAVFEFSPEVARKWNFDTTGVIVIPNSEDGIEGIKSGDVLVAWETFIFFVEKLETTDAGTAVSVRKFSVADAIYGEFDVPFFEGTTPTPQIGEVSWPKIEVDLAKFGEVASKLGNATTIEGGLDFPVSVEGGFRGKIPRVSGYTCQGETISGYCVDYLLAKLTLGVDAYINATFQAEKSFEYGFDEPIKLSVVDSFNSRIGRIPLGSSGLAIQPQLEIPGALKITASGEATVQFQAEASGRLPLGFEYFNAGYQGRSSDSFQFLPNSNHPTSFSNSHSTEASGSAKVVIHQHIGVGIGFRIVPAATSSVGISGVGFAGRVNEDITLDPFKPNNCLQAEFYFDASAKAQIKFFIDSWVGDWEWDLMDDSGANSQNGKVVDGTIPIGEKITFAKSESGSLFCLDEGTAKKLRLTVTSTSPPGKEEGDNNGYELDGVSVTRITGSGVGGSSETWHATSAFGGGNSSAATGEPDAKQCSSYNSKVADVNGTIELTFAKSFKDGDSVQIYQFVTGHEIGNLGACYPSGTVKVEVGDGSNWNEIKDEIQNGIITIEGSDLNF